MLVVAVKSDLFGHRLQWIDVSFYGMVPINCTSIERLKCQKGECQTMLLMSTVVEVNLLKFH